jgi:GntR family transcriptional regulator, vanillate catabolism transcriptional regulator
MITARGGDHSRHVGFARSERLQWCVAGSQNVKKVPAKLGEGHLAAISGSQVDLMGSRAEYHAPMNTQLTQAIVRIREMILRGELAPGQRVAEAPVADLLGVSRTPVRQALPLLAQEGLLSEHETRGYVVRAFTAADIVDAIDLRGALEGLAVRRVTERGASKALLRELRACLEDGEVILNKRHVDENDEGLYADMNERFHRLILVEAGSALLAETLARNSRIPFAGPQALAFDKGNLEQMYDMLRYAHRQHYAIVEALERGQSARAEALMREHANSAKESINLTALPVAAGETGRLTPARISGGGV